MYLAIDIGGTHVRFGFSGSTEDVQLTDYTTLLNDHDFDKYIEKIISSAKKHLPIKGVGISVTGDLNPSKTMIIDASLNAPELLNQPLVDLFSNKLNCPVVVDNDANMAALGEFYYGEMKQHEFVYLIWGTGIGGTVVRQVGEQVVTQQLDWYEYFDRWEEECGGDAILKKLSISPEKLSEEQWQSILQKFAQHLTNFSNQINQKIIVLNGLISQAKFPILKRMVNIQKEVKLSRLGPQAGLFGALIALNSLSTK